MIEMKRRPLNLEELADEIIRIEYPNYEIYHPHLRASVLAKRERIKEIIQRHIKMACSFYLHYSFDSVSFRRKYPAYNDLIRNMFLFGAERLEYIYWLVRFTFGCLDLNIWGDEKSCWR